MASLKRLGTDHIDLYWVHFPDGLPPVEEILRGIDDLVARSCTPACPTSPHGAIAEESGATPAQVSMTWIRELAARASTSFIPIIGPRDLTQLDTYLDALDVRLTPQQLVRLADVSAVPLGVIHEAIARTRDSVQGGDAGRVIAPAVSVA